ncbi:MAG: hypothetical protein HY841_08610 [Bacteroidetes bacterium]|nr:hypothetical protein [Bacteroidota bacterium]
MTLTLKYSLLNSAMGLIVGLLVLGMATGDGYFMFPIAAAMAAFVTGGLFWKIINGNSKDLKTPRVILTGILTGSISHYVCWILVSAGMNICYLTTGKCTDSFGGPPASVASMLIGSFAFTFFSLLFFGWLTIPVSTAIGLFLKFRQKNKNVQQL